MYNLFKDVEITSTDLIAVLIIGVMLIFKLTGHNGTLDTSVAIIVGYYFGKRHIGMKNDSNESKS